MDLPGGSGEGSEQTSSVSATEFVGHIKKQFEIPAELLE